MSIIQYITKHCPERAWINQCCYEFRCITRFNGRLAWVRGSCLYELGESSCRQDDYHSGEIEAMVKADLWMVCWGASTSVACVQWKQVCRDQRKFQCSLARNIWEVESSNPSSGIMCLWRSWHTRLRQQRLCTSWGICFATRSSLGNHQSRTPGVWRQVHVLCKCLTGWICKR